MSARHFDHLSGLRARFEGYLPSTLDRLATCPPRLREAVAYSLLASGKRLRPLLTMLACEAAGGSADDALPAAAAVEMVHTYSLVHDDLPAMDDDDLRRGRPTCHKQFDEATAILAGDALLTLAFELLACSYAPQAAQQCIAALAMGAGAAGMVGGQVLDLEAETADGPASVEALEQIHRLKTGALFRACTRMGWFAAPEATRPSIENAVNRLDEFIANLGLAFQITDDLLDVEGDAATAGKAVGKDAARGKLTYPGLLGIDESRNRAKGMIQRAKLAVEPFGLAGQRLADLAESIVDRSR